MVKKIHIMRYSKKISSCALHYFVNKKEEETEALI